jgi:hypothetical protein
MVGRVAIALLGTSATCDNAGLERGSYDAEIGLGLTGHDPAGRVAHVGAVKVEPNAPHQVGHVRLAEAGVGAASTPFPRWHLSSGGELARRRPGARPDRPRLVLERLDDPFDATSRADE